MVFRVIDSVAVALTQEEERWWRAETGAWPGRERELCRLKQGQVAERGYMNTPFTTFPFSIQYARCRIDSYQIE